MSVHKVLVIGAYGFLGAEISRKLVASGYTVLGFGRNEREARRALPRIKWMIADLRDMATSNDWMNALEDVDAVVNCAGLLQDSGRETVADVHDRALSSLIEACESQNVGMIHISSVGADSGASTEFLRTKAEGEQRIIASGLSPYWIFRPGLVIGPTAYGGSSLLRMVASIPTCMPLAFPDTAVQTVAIDDVSDSVLRALGGGMAPNARYDLVEPAPRTLRDILRLLRDWIGWKPAMTEPTLPKWVVRFINRSSDGLAHLGWKPPVRTTASYILKAGIVGDPEPLFQQTGAYLSPLEQTLERYPAQSEDRLSALIQLLKPVTLITLCVFWFLSGIIGLLELSKAASTLTDVGWSFSLSVASVTFWSVVDIGLAIMLAFKRTAKHACWGMVAVSIIYLISASAIIPHLWADPLGPLVKVLPGIALALVARAMLEVR